VDAERAAILENAHQDAGALLDQTVAEVRVEAQSLRLRRREQLLDRVFSEARARLASATHWPDYAEIGEALVRDAVSRIDSDEMIVRADPATQRVLGGDLLETVGRDLGVKLLPGDTLAQGTGVIVATADGHRRFDNTLETRLNRMHDRLRAPVFHILMGEEP
jgi:vacuolar-type H+-ATPase subunit E/Vma4